MNIATIPQEVAEIENMAHEEGISIASICRRADVHGTTFGRWKKGESEPRGSKIRAMKNALQEMVKEKCPDQEEKRAAP